MSYKRRSTKQKSDTNLNLKEIFLLQLTACGIIMLGFLVASMLSDNFSHDIRAGLGQMLNNQEFFAQSPYPGEVGDASTDFLYRDFRINEELLEDNPTDYGFYDAP